MEVCMVVVLFWEMAFLARCLLRVLFKQVLVAEQLVSGVLLVLISVLLSFLRMAIQGSMQHTLEVGSRNAA